MAHYLFSSAHTYVSGSVLCLHVGIVGLVSGRWSTLNHIYGYDNN